MYARYYALYMLTLCDFSCSDYNLIIIDIADIGCKHESKSPQYIIYLPVLS